MQATGSSKPRHGKGLLSRCTVGTVLKQYRFVQVSGKGAWDVESETFFCILLQFYFCGLIMSWRIYPTWEKPLSLGELTSIPKLPLCEMELKSRVMMPANYEDFISYSILVAPNSATKHRYSVYVLFCAVLWGIPVASSWRTKSQAC